MLLRSDLGCRRCLILTQFEGIGERRLCYCSISGAV
ncbi:unnamed protein product [Rhodiola kirilowii]